MKSKTNLWFLALALILSGFTQAQEKRSLSLKEAITLSLKNSNSLKGSEARIEEAMAALREAIERKLPDASVSGSYLRLANPNIDIKTKSNNSSGGTTNQTPKPSQAAYGLVNLSLPVYSGLRIQYGIQSAKYLAEAAKLDADNDREAVILNAIDAYNSLYKAKSAVNLVQENLQAAGERVKQLSSLEQNGLLARNDLLKAQLQVSNTELSLLDAQNNWKLANISMNLLLGLPENTELEPDSGNFKIADDQLKTIEDYLQLGLQNRKDLSALSLRKKAAATGVKATEGEKYPSIALTGGYIAADVPKILTVTNAVNVGVGVQYNIGSLWKNKAKVDQAKAREKQVAANEAVLADAIQLQIAQAYQTLLSNQKKIEVYNNAVAQAVENYRIVKNKYENSLATTTDLLDADVAQLQARLNYSFAQSDAVVAYNKLLQAAGLLTDTENK